MFLGEMYCPVCRETKTVGLVAGEPHPTCCLDCQRKLEQEEKQEKLNPLKLMSVTERLSRIEGILYDLQKQSHGPRWDG